MSASPSSTPDPAALRAALAARRPVASVEADGALAILRLDGGSPPDAAERASLVALARASGFTHLALELPAPAEPMREPPLA